MAEHHRHLLVHAVRVEYVFRDDIPKKGGKQTWATAHKASSLAAFLANYEGNYEDTDGNSPFFCIVVSKPIWDRLKEPQRIALIDHELCHCGAVVEEDAEGNSKVKLSIIPHDLEEFRSIVKRHGYWQPDLKAFAKTVNEHQDCLQFDSFDDFDSRDVFRP